MRLHLPHVVIRGQDYMLDDKKTTYRCLRTGQMAAAGARLQDEDELDFLNDVGRRT
jgi:hypothetical protein